MSGLFITVEGTDGCGKTTQIKLLEEYFEKGGYSVVCVRDPGSTPIGEKIRKIIIDPDNKEMCSTTETLLYAAARAQMVEQIIRPALKRGSVVISDRYIDSSYAYQGFARGMGAKMIKDINKYAIDDIIPDITIFLQLKPEQGIERKKNQAELDRMEAQKNSFHKRVYDGYTRLAKNNRKRIKIVDAAGTIDDVHLKIISLIEDMIRKREI